MDDILIYCPRCHFALEIPPEFDNAICGGCGTPYWVRRHGGALSLSEIWPGEDSPRVAKTGAAIDLRLAEIDELIEEAESEIGNLKSREQSAPLQMGCAFFGLLLTIIVLTALFMFLGKGYVGSWVFYATIAAVILIGLARIRRTLTGPLEREKLRKDRIPIEGGLAQLHAERTRLQELKRDQDERELGGAGNS
jgi:hypothetical protein